MATLLAPHTAQSMFDAISNLTTYYCQQRQAGRLGHDYGVRARYIVKWLGNFYKVLASISFSKATQIFVDFLGIFYLL